MSRKALIIDGNNRLYAAYFAYDNLSYEGKPTSCVYGMPSMIRALVNDIKPDDLYVVWDGHKNPTRYRQKILPAYKQHRSSNALVDLDDLIRQKLVVQKLFSSMGVKQILNDDLEGDDTIYALYKTIRKRFDIIIINTGDKDFNQLLNSKVRIYSESKKTLITRKNVKKYFGYYATETVDWLSLVGDKSDDIPGLGGCGETTARRLLDKYGSVSNFLKSGDSFPRVDREKLLEVYPRNRKLISLPYFYKRFVKGKKPLNYLFTREPEVNKSLMQRIAASNGTKRFLDPNFIKPFKHLKYGR